MLVSVSRALVVGLVAALGLVYAPGSATAAPPVGVTPSPVSAPGSIMGKGGFGANFFNSALIERPNGLPLKANFGIPKLGMSTVVTGGAVGPAVGVAATALVTSFATTRWVGNNVFGWETTGSLMCDLTTIVAGNCSTGAAPDYVPNSDVGMIYPGWTDTPVVSAIWIGCGDQSGCGGFPLTNTEVVMTEPITPPFAVPGDVFPTFTVIPNPYDSAAMLEGGSTSGKYGPYYYDVVSATEQPIGGSSQAWKTTKVPAGAFPEAGKIGVGDLVPWDHVLLRQIIDGKLTVVARWYPTGHQLRPPEQDADPLRHFETRFQCSTGATGVSVSGTFRESDAQWAPIPEGICEEGFLTHYEVVQVTQGLPEVVIITWDLPDDVRSWVEDNPECVAEVCVLDLAKVVPGTNAKTSCFDDPAGCVDWWMDPNRAQNYECTYNGAVLAVEECAVYRPTFNPRLTAQGTSYADPTTGELPTPVPAPAPGPGGAPSPSSSECFPSGWGVFNPAEWVLKPVSCALSWAFVPRAGTIQKTLTDLEVGLRAKAPFSVILVIPEVVGEIGDGWNAGCAGMPDFSGIKGLHLQLPCEPPASAAWRVAYMLQTIILWTTVSISAWHMVSRSIGGKE